MEDDLEAFAAALEKTDSPPGPAEIRHFMLILLRQTAALAAHQRDLEQRLEEMPRPDPEPVDKGARIQIDRTDEKLADLKHRLTQLDERVAALDRRQGAPAPGLPRR